MDSDYQIKISTSINPDSILSNGNIRMNEGAVFHNYEITITVHFRESFQHNRPHCNVAYGQYNFEVYLDDPITAFNSNANSGVEKNVIKHYIVPNINDLRKAWNQIPNAVYKFIEQNGIYYCK
jgi:hypothetical protein